MFVSLKLDSRSEWEYAWQNNSIINTVPKRRWVIRLEKYGDVRKLGASDRRAMVVNKVHQAQIKEQNMV